MSGAYGGAFPDFFPARRRKSDHEGHGIVDGVELTELLGMRHPIVLAPMGGAAGGALTAAVSRAGGLGLLGGAYGNREWLARELSVVAKGTDQPWGSCETQADIHPYGLTALISGLPDELAATPSDGGPHVGGVGHGSESYDNTAACPCLTAWVMPARWRGGPIRSPSFDLRLTVCSVLVCGSRSMGGSRPRTTRVRSPHGHGSCCKRSP
ncbi:nitronate monooxygenase [Kitasatospora acidiphila]|uniref:nitronate monooxygenase n=1 Tax=Kitasatospora acidiphila TaxID=2567942 RepID=UPI003C779C59